MGVDKMGVDKMGSRHSGNKPQQHDKTINAAFVPIEKHFEPRHY